LRLLKLAARFSPVIIISSVVVSTATTNDWLALEADFTGQKELRLSIGSNRDLEWRFALGLDPDYLSDSAFYEVD
jgi:hypothetical protein